MFHLVGLWNKIDKDLLCWQSSLFFQHDSLHAHACLPGKVDGLAPQHPSPHSASEFWLAAVSDIGLVVQLPYRFIAQLVEQPDTGKHAVHASLNMHILAMT